MFAKKGSNLKDMNLKKKFFQKSREKMSGVKGDKVFQDLSKLIKFFMKGLKNKAMLRQSM